MRNDLAAAQRARVRRRILLIALIGLAPVVAAYATYYVWPHARQANYGALHVIPAPPLTGQRLDASAFALTDLRGKWVIVSAAPGACDARCAAQLYASRQARTIQNAERDRVVRVWLVTDAATPSPALLGEHRDLLPVRTAPATAAVLPGGGRDVYLIDPLGNLVLSWPADPDIKRMARDLTRLLRASSIG